ncbi:heavy metal-binding domain-containing protein [Sedimentisphaera salicampi]|uniref:Uncharacterized protein n=1 Tax=Sedimentisphaera salicampi TaxID=1941349 RepID=A0A1W6LN64_9BACT|nr:heavy metal-binding domain-containing protein [Sedimentisphaera salicampi]ARN57219.1 hypothetical protein STSP1_01617 [Sedimentisphaera salicampi]
MITFKCPTCSHKLKAKYSKIGQTISCPVCDEKIKIPILDKCPNCGEPIVLEGKKQNAFLSQNSIALINEFNEKNFSIMCQKCGTNPYYNTINKIRDKIKELYEAGRTLLNQVPIVSTHSPQNWDYNVLDIVTSQTVSGTGFISDIASSFTDFFGATSGTYNQKIKDSEKLCKQILRVNAVNLNANAIIAVDIDYSSVGKTTGMLMVCMTGTAVQLKNTKEVLEEYRANQLTELISSMEEIKRLENILKKESSRK